MPVPDPVPVPGPFSRPVALVGGRGRRGGHAPCATSRRAPRLRRMFTTRFVGGSPMMSGEGSQWGKGWGGCCNRFLSVANGKRGRAGATHWFLQGRCAVELANRGARGRGEAPAFRE